MKKTQITAENDEFEEICRSSPPRFFRDLGRKTSFKKIIINKNRFWKFRNGLCE